MTPSKNSAIILLLIIVLAGCSGTTPAPTVVPQPTVTRIPPTLMNQALPTQPTSTTIPTYTPTSAASAVYYLIVLDASADMSSAFDGKTKLDAARASAQTILDALEPEANYALVTIGGSTPTEGVDPCGEPSVARRPFSIRSLVTDQLNQLQPAGGGSLYSAVRLGLNQFEGVPDNSIRVLMVITGSADNCQRDEWSDLEQQFKVDDEARFKLHSELIVLSDVVDPKLQTVTDRMVKRSENLQIQFATDSASLGQANEALIQHVKDYVANGIATRPTEGPALSSYTITPIPGAMTNTPGASSYTITPIPGALTSTLSASSYTITPKPGTATFTPTLTFTPVPITFTVTLTPTITPTATATLPPSVEVISANFRTTGIGCQADIVVKVSGSPAEGSFHVANSSNEPIGEVYAQVLLPVGTFGGNVVTLSGNQPATYQHEVWFELTNGVQSNHLTGLQCPLLPKSTPTP